MESVPDRDPTPKRTAHTAVPAPRYLVAVDVDGTLLDTEFEDRLRPREKEAIDAVRKVGHEVALCTGRNSRSVAGLLAKSDWQPVDLPLVLLNGAVVVGGDPYRQLASRDLDRATVRRLVEIFHAHDALAMVYDTDERGGSLHHEQRDTNDILTRYLQLRRETVGAIVTVSDLLQHLPDSALEVGTIDVREVVFGLSDQIRTELGDRVRVINTMSLLGGGKYYWAEVYHHGCDKGRGATMLARAAGIPETQIIAIGDNYNDLDLFAVAASSVAMGNSPDEVKQAADHVVASVADSGAAAVLERIAAGEFPLAAPDEETDT